MKKIIFAMLASLTFIVSVEASEKAKFKAELLGNVEFATFSDFTKKMILLGKMLNNPMISTMLVSTLQQSVEASYGRMRPDSPFTLYAYQTERLEKDEDSIDDVIEFSVIYPSAEKPNTFVMSRPGAVKNPDGTIVIPEKADSPESYVVYSKDQQFAAHSENLNVAKESMADFEKKYLKAKVSSAVMKADINRAGIVFLATYYENMQKKLNDDKKTLMHAKQSANIERLKTYKTFSFSFDLTDKGMEFKGTGIRLPGGKPYENLALPAGIMNVPEKAPVFAAFNHKYMQGSEDVSPELIGEIFSNLDKCVESEKAKIFVKALEPAVKEFLADTKKITGKEAGIIWVGLNKSKHLYLASYDNVDANYNAELKFLDKAVSAQKTAWGENAVFAKGTSEGDYLFDIGKLIDIEGIEPGKPVPSEVTIAKGKIKSIIGDTKLYFGVKKFEGGILEYISSPGYTPVMGAGTGEKDYLKVIPEAATERPVSAGYAELYSFVRDVVLPTVAKTAAAEERMQYDMMIAAMPQPLPGSAIASAVWVKGNKEEGIIRVTANELKNIGAVFNVFAAAALAAPEETENDE